MPLTASLLHALMPRANPIWVPALNDAATEFNITPPKRLAAWLANLAHESVELTHLEENLNYSAERLAQTWPRFSLTGQRGGPPNDRATLFAHKPQALANYVYAGVNGNGDVASGDGWRFRGRCPIQLTGRGNYRRAGIGLGLPLEAEPDRALLFDIGARIAGWFWADKSLNALADIGDLVGITKKINGGTLGLHERQAYYDRFMLALA
jgi:putative chitinase